MDLTHGLCKQGPPPRLPGARTQITSLWLSLLGEKALGTKTSPQLSAFTLIVTESQALQPLEFVVHKVKTNVPVSVAIKTGLEQLPQLNPVDGLQLYIPVLVVP